ncbi:CDP-alcohol phosphatidyltransferase family protein [Solibaculum mannosilyticum]|uniref:CDP-diacylglycerol--glycerol-3-phosphate 3-phosphatidyltransferase n=1 Tax=Solibaculum mannosilyticum TaxID=2780922 RepID=A0A7I8D8I5_9FIRM|nr:CDP-alcohol phosphatidyltransferase family protein [Solibaculum mannosilyticum]MCO7136003.1 CDP-alcohol phosphatidyltransferase family protein [[Clostridium] leptum]BCI61513.1 CDP-alcohol phosphatidyltransferase [Solibaculum mannosilyticum]CZT55732.1 CDP-diacylglycerol--glycerol-3-phosphate 3-phosphatidyltransferase [Eubacteriaceae bacterium CHKCI005]
MSKSNQVFTIPNLLSAFRIVLVPVFLVLYLGKAPDDIGIGAGVVLLISGITDMLDGYIARRFNQVTTVGQILDPIADKLTQASVVISIAIVHRENKFLIPLVCIFVLKEVFMGLGSLMLLKRGKRPSAALWFGKLGTIVFYIVMLLIMFIPDIPNAAMTVMIAIVAGFMIFAFVRYAMVFLEILREGHKNPPSSK